jgi:hypothetical protein
MQVFSVLKHKMQASFQPDMVSFKQLLKIRL